MKKLIAIAALVCGTAHAEYFTGNDIQRWSEETTNNISWGMMYGYIAGVADTGQAAVFCIPQNVRLQQIVDLVKNHVAGNPATRHLSADNIIIYVLKQTWPCAEKKKGTSL
jgi:hypothetical protein